MSSHNNTHDNNRGDEPYICVPCGGHVFPSRPPTYNPQNCSCSDRVFANGGGTHVNQALEYDKKYHYNHTLSVYHQPESFTTDKSAPGQEGIEGNLPDLHTANSWAPLPLTSRTPGLNEVNVHHSSNRSFAVTRWLESEGQINELSYGTQHTTCSPNKYLNQSNHIQAPTTQKKSNKSKPSVRSAGSGDLGMADSWTREDDATTGAGGWVYSNGDYFEVTHDYPYATELSGLFD